MEVICLDTDILIEHKRAKEHEKENTKFFKVATKYKFAVSVITAFELLRGDNSAEDIFWKNFFSKVEILEMDMPCAEIAGDIYRNLKKNGTMIGIEDILIASIALRNRMKLASNNNEHFNRIDGLEVI